MSLVCGRTFWHSVQSSDPAASPACALGRPRPSVGGRVSHHNSELRSREEFLTTIVLAINMRTLTSTPKFKIRFTGRMRNSHAKPVVLETVAGYRVRQGSTQLLIREEGPNQTVLGKHDFTCRDIDTKSIVTCYDRCEIPPAVRIWHSCWQPQSWFKQQQRRGLLYHLNLWNFRYSYSTLFATANVITCSCRLANSCRRQRTVSRCECAAL